jgi:hypothetical protein
VGGFEVSFRAAIPFGGKRTSVPSSSTAGRQVDLRKLSREMLKITRTVVQITCCQLRRTNSVNSRGRRLYEAIVAILQEREAAAGKGRASRL